MKSPRIGCVKYLNARLLIRGWSGNVTSDSPAALCAQLACGNLDVALVSSFEFLRNPVYRIVDDVSISSAGPVYSVFVAHRGNISEVEEIKLDPAAGTSGNLLRCLLAELNLNPRLVGKDQLEKRAQREVLGSAGCQSAVAGSLPATPGGTPRAAKLTRASRQAAETNRLAAVAPQTWRSKSPADARLLIGDQAIRFRQNHPEFRFWDLGEQWEKLVDLPFVYALWLIRPEVADVRTIADRLRARRDENLVNIHELIAEEREFDPDFCNRYYREHLRFSFGEREKRGLQTFANLCAKHGLISQGEIELALV